MLGELSLQDFLAQTASNEPVPGGGSIAAMGAASAAALTEMVANLTIGRKKYEAVEAEMKEIQEIAKGLRERLIEDIDRDAASFNSVMDAMKLPKETESEKQARTAAIQEATKKAAQVPLEVAKAALEMMPIIEKIVSRGNQNAVTDGAVAAMMARTAVLAALYNVKINLTSLKDEDFVTALRKQVQEIEQGALQWEREILSKVNL